MAKYVNFKTLDTRTPAKNYAYVAFGFQAAAESIKSVIDLAVGTLGDDNLEDLWALYNDLRESALALEPDFDANCIIETGKLQGPPGGFAHMDTVVDSYLAYREAYEEA